MPVPHHDGSELYVSNRAPKLGDKVTLRVRVPKKDPAKEIFVRILQDGEPVTYPLKKAKATRVENWFQVSVEIVSPISNYRFLLRDGKNFRWLNAAGVFARDVVDHFDFKITAHHDAPSWLPILQDPYVYIFYRILFLHLNLEVNLLAQFWCAIADIEPTAIMMR